MMQVTPKNALPVLLVALAVALDAPPAYSQGGGSLSGTVLLDGSAPVYGSRVVVSRIPRLIRDARGRPAVDPASTFSRSATSGLGGGFQINSVPAGRYYVCAQAIAASQINSCDWNDGGPAVSVTDGGIANVTLTIRTGVLLKFAVSDAAGRLKVLDPTGIRAAQTNLVIAVESEARATRVAKLVASEAGEWRYQLAVPRATKFRVYLHTPLTVLDSLGQALRTGVPAFSIATGSEADLTVSLVVR
jgi:hypothetical protein